MVQNSPKIYTKNNCVDYSIVLHFNSRRIFLSITINSIDSFNYFVMNYFDAILCHLKETDVLS